MNLRLVFSECAGHIRKGINSSPLTVGWLSGWSVSAAYRYAFNGAAPHELKTAALCLVGIAAAGALSHVIDRHRNPF